VGNRKVFIGIFCEIFMTIGLPKRILLELDIDDSGLARLAGTSLGVKIKRPLGGPKTFSGIDYINEVGSERGFHLDRLDRLQALAPEGSNAYCMATEWDDRYVEESGDGVIHMEPVQFYELEKSSVQEALSAGGLI
jgi:hypothetical protein